MELHGVYIGLPVHYILTEADVHRSHRSRIGQHIAAIIVGKNSEEGDVNLTIFPDWQDDGIMDYTRGANPEPVGISSRKFVQFSFERVPGSWHFAEPCEQDEKYIAYRLRTRLPETESAIADLVETIKRPVGVAE